MSMSNKCSLRSARGMRRRVYTKRLYIHHRQGAVNCNAVGSHTDD